MKLALAITGIIAMAMSVTSVPNTLRGLEKNEEKTAIDTSGPPPLDTEEEEEDEDFLVKPEEVDTSNTDEHHRALAGPKSQYVTNDDPGGYDSSYFQSSFARNPGLSGFYFNFLTSPRPVKRIRVKPYTSSASVAYYDYNKDDDYYWQLKAVELPPETTYHTASGSYGYGCITTADLIYAAGKVPVLQGFDLEFNNHWKSNRALEQVQVHLFMNGPFVRLTVCFNDDNNDDRFSYNIDYALVPATSVAYNGYSTGLRTDYGGSATQHCYSNSQYYGMVLSGFNLRFKYSTRNMDRIGIWMSGTTCYGYFDDDNDDDDYEWNVWYHLVKA